MINSLLSINFVISEMHFELSSKHKESILFCVNNIFPFESGQYSLNNLIMELPTISLVPFLEIIFLITPECFE